MATSGDDPMRKTVPWGPTTVLPTKAVARSAAAEARPSRTACSTSRWEAPEVKRVEPAHGAPGDLARASDALVRAIVDEAFQQEGHVRGRGLEGGESWRGVAEREPPHHRMGQDGPHGISRRVPGGKARQRRNVDVPQQGIDEAPVGAVGKGEIGHCDQALLLHGCGCFGDQGAVAFGLAGRAQLHGGLALPARAAIHQQEHVGILRGRVRRQAQYREVALHEAPHGAVLVQGGGVLEGLRKVAHADTGMLVCAPQGVSRQQEQAHLVRSRDERGAGCQAGHGGLEPLPLLHVQALGAAVIHAHQGMVHPSCFGPGEHAPVDLGVASTGGQVALPEVPGQQGFQGAPFHRPASGDRLRPCQEEFGSLALGLGREVGRDAHENGEGVHGGGILPGIEPLLGTARALLEDPEIRGRCPGGHESAVQHHVRGHDDRDGRRGLFEPVEEEIRVAEARAASQQAGRGKSEVKTCQGSKALGKPGRAWAIVQGDEREHHGRGSGARRAESVDGGAEGCSGASDRLRRVSGDDGPDDDAACAGSGQGGDGPRDGCGAGWE